MLPSGKSEKYYNDLTSKKNDLLVKNKPALVKLGYQSHSFPVVKLDRLAHRSVFYQKFEWASKSLC